MGKAGLRGAIAILALAVLGACNQGPPVEVNTGTIEQTLYWSRSLQGKRVAIEGYIGFDNGPEGKAIASGPSLRSQPYGAGQTLLMIATEFGGGPNQISAPGMKTGPMFGGASAGAPDIVTFNPNEMVYHDDKGGSHPINHRARAIGRVEYAIDIQKDPRSPSGHRFRPFLTRVTLEAPPGS